MKIETLAKQYTETKDERYLSDLVKLCVPYCYKALHLVQSSRAEIDAAIYEAIYRTTLAHDAQRRFVPLLMRVLRNTIVDHHRAALGRNGGKLVETFVQVDIPHNPDPIKTLVRQEEVRLLFKRLTTTRHRSLLALRLGGLSLAEAGKALQMRQGSTSTYWHRIKQIAKTIKEA